MADLAVIFSVLAATAIGVAFINFCSSLAEVDFQPEARGEVAVSSRESSQGVPGTKEEKP